MDACVPYSMSIKGGAGQRDQGKQEMPFPAKNGKRRDGGEEIENNENVHVKCYALVWNYRCLLEPRPFG